MIGDGDPGKLFHMQTNLRFGCVILRHYLEREKGNMYLALGRYNGSRASRSTPMPCLLRSASGCSKRKHKYK